MPHATAAAAAPLDTGDGPTFLSLAIYHFTPIHALLGGLLLGMATLMKMLLKGEVLGISGVAKGLVQGAAGDVQRWCFLLGLLGCSFAQRWFYPVAFGVVDIPMARCVVAGLAIGAGAALGNGCTSGHGISGNARLAPRSLVFTACFMATGFLTATVMGSTTAVITTVTASPIDLQDTLVIAGTALGAHLVAYMAAAACLVPASARFVTDVLDGSLFAIGLGISGMTNPTRVVEFLDLHARRWNPTLMFVMGSALGLMVPAMQLGVLRGRPAHPWLADKFRLPTISQLDAKLIAGGLLFGMGWGLAGMCPGPALCNAANPHGAPLGFLLAMFAAFFVLGRLPPSSSGANPAQDPLLRPAVQS